MGFNRANFAVFGLHDRFVRFRNGNSTRLGRFGFQRAINRFFADSSRFCRDVGHFERIYRLDCTESGPCVEPNDTFIPGGVILGGVTSPLSHLSPWVVTFSHIFPLTWEFHFTRDIIQRGANLSQISSEIGAFFVYTAIVAVLLCLRFNFERNKLLKSSAIENLDTPPDFKPESIVKNILVPTDGSGQAFKALLQAISVAEAWGARITLMMVVKLDDDVADFEKVSLSGYIPSELTATAQNLLNELRQVVPDEFEVKTRVEIGDPAEEILNASTDFDLIIMGNRSFGSFDKENLGSVAKFVQDNSKTPVIFAKGMPEDWDDENNFLGGKNIWK